MEFYKNDKKSSEIERRPKPARRRKPCSKIEAKLLSRRRSKLENEEKKLSSLEVTPKNSSSDSDLSPRFYTSKQHVELVNFDTEKMIATFEKNDKNLLEQSDKCETKNHDDSSSEIQTFGNESQRSLVLNRRSQNFEIFRSNQDFNDSKSTGKHDEKIDLLNIYTNKELQHLSAKESNESETLKSIEFNKKRSRSAPCTPLFRIKCSKDKYPRDSLIDVKNLAANEIREKIFNPRRNVPLHVRLSRSGDVSISSCEKSSDERIIEGRSSSEKPETDEASTVLTLFPVKSRKLEIPEAADSMADPAAEKSFESEGIEAKEENNKSDEKNELAKSSQSFSNDLSTIENIGEIVSRGETREEKKIGGIEKNEETTVSLGNKDHKVEEKYTFSRKLPPKKREFKWDTILEKQYRQSAPCRSKDCKKSPALAEKLDNDKMKLWNERSVNPPSKNTAPKSRISFEANKLAAYSAIKEELPRLFMKRQISDAMKKKKKEFEERTKLVREADHANAHDWKKIDHGNVRVWKKAEITSQFIKSDAENFECTRKENFWPKKSFPDKCFDENNFRCNECPTNIDDSRAIQRPSILKRRKTPSPRRVTFRLPGRIIDDDKADEPIHLANKFKDETLESDNSYDSLDKFDQKIERNENTQNSRHYCSTRNKCRTIQAPESTNHRVSKNIAVSPRLYGGGERENYRDSEDSEQDWETPTSEDIYRDPNEIRFPKETKEAMNILRTAESKVQCDRFDRCQKKMNDVERSCHNKRAASYRKQSSQIASSYAVALTKFQERCDHEGHQKSTLTRRQNRGSRNPNVAVELNEKGDLKAGIKTYSGNINSENFRICESVNLTNQLREDSTKFRDILACHDNTRTMQSNGSESGNTENGIDRTGWTVGLINGKFKYLTAETFGFKINANGASLKKKQLWTLEGSEHQVFLRSHLDRYLAVDQFGNVTCEAEDSSDAGCAFQIQLASDGSGRWALKNVQRGYFLGSSQDELKCMAKAPGEAEYWLVHLAARPQVNLRSAGRKRFAHLSASQDEIHVDAPVPWGEDTLFTLEFRAAATADNEAGPGHGQGGKTEGGHYALHTCNNKYLARDGKLLDSCTRDCLYAAEFHAGLLALRDIHGAYLAPIGSKAVLKSRSTTVTRDELFSLEESLPQASFVAALNQRYVSVKQGVDVTANQDEISGHETFQLEFDRVTKRWYVRTMQDRYWSLEAGGGIQASDHKRSSNALFDLVWQTEDGTVSLRANNGKFLATKRSGHLYANADSPDSGDSDASKYYFYLMNRPILVLRCEQGFVGPKSAASPKLECNKAGYETIRVERCERGIVRFKGQNGKYWHADSEGVTVDSDLPSAGFYLELREPSRLCIKCTDGRYLTAGKNGALRLGETDHDSATKWEF